MCKKKKAFTLIELLVVIAIIALLLAVITPALRKAKEQARTMICGTRLKQMGVALILYAENNNDEFVTQDWLTPREPGYWFLRIGPYIEDADGDKIMSGFMRCPSGQAIKDYGDDTTDVIVHHATDYGLKHFGASSYYFNANGEQVMDPQKLSRIKLAGRFSAIFDFYFGEKNSGNLTSGSIYKSKWFLVQEYIEALSGERAKLMRHKDGINVVYADCSVALGLKGSTSLKALGDNRAVFKVDVDSWWDENMRSQ